MIQNIPGYPLPLPDAQKMAIYRQARQAAAEAFAAFSAAIAARLRRRMARRPVGSHAAGQTG